MNVILSYPLKYLTQSKIGSTAVIFSFFWLLFCFEYSFESKNHSLVFNQLTWSETQLAQDFRK